MKQWDYHREHRGRRERRIIIQTKKLSLCPLCSLWFPFFFPFFFPFLFDCIGIDPIHEPTQKSPAENRRGSEMCGRKTSFYEFDTPEDQEHPLAIG